MVASAKALAMTFELLPDGRSGRIDFLVCAVGNESSSGTSDLPQRHLSPTTPGAGFTTHDATARKRENYPEGYRSGAITFLFRGREYGQPRIGLDLEAGHDT
jgi:hypothetical protein